MHCTVSPNPHQPDYPPDAEPTPVSTDPLIYSTSASLCVEHVGSLTLHPHNIHSLSLTPSLEIFKHICRVGFKMIIQINKMSKVHIQW